MTTDDPLRFEPGPECARPGCCDLSCVWPFPADAPLVWEGDQA